MTELTPVAEPSKGQTKPPRKPVAAKKFSLDDLKLELRRIEWPTRENASKLTGQVLVIVVLFMFFVVGIDFVASKLVSLVQSFR